MPPKSKYLLKHWVFSISVRPPKSWQNLFFQLWRHLGVTLGEVVGSTLGEVSGGFRRHDGGRQQGTDRPSLQRLWAVWD
jgi:hypothetical protein